ncbi:hypothetical protein [uncultured Bacteroides sp.]|uniref:hypothetical protein n=1 Tax=uncultured Bacteroides sp. TaxID=162156 RepID=UPI002AA94829|nr:hypothetical protein [uncultured Bacteroides sp.]
MKTYLLISLLMFSLRIFSQEMYNQENEVNTLNKYSNIEKMDNKNVPLLGTSESYLYKSGVYLQKSANFRYLALGSLAAGIIISSAGSNSNENSSSNNGRDIYYAVGGIFLASSLVCTIISINYKMKAGKQLKISASGMSACIAYIF